MYLTLHSIIFLPHITTSKSFVQLKSLQRRQPGRTLTTQAVAAPGCTWLRASAQLAVQEQELPPGAQEVPPARRPQPRPVEHHQQDTTYTPN